MFQLVYFVIFVLLVAPVVFSAVRVEQHTDEQLGQAKEGNTCTQQAIERDAEKGRKL